MTQATGNNAFRIVGQITRPHGVKGMLKVRPETDDPARFSELETLFLGSDEQTLHPVQVVSVGFQPFKAGTAVLLELQGVEGREAAEALNGKLVWAREADLPPLEEGEVFLSDLVGISVMSAGRQVGTVADVLELPAHPTLSVRTSEGATVMVPFVPAWVPEVDLDAGVLTVAEIEGLLEGEPLSERD